MKSLAKNYIWNLSYQVLVAVLPLITAPYLARVLGAEKIGAYSFVHSIVSCFVLVAVSGTALYGQRTIAKCHAQGETPKQVFCELLLLRVIGVCASLGIYFLSVFQLADDRMLYLVVAVEILAAALDISWFYQGIEEFGKITVCNGFCKILSVTGIFLLVKDRSDLNLYALLVGGTILLGNVMQWSFLRSVWQPARLGKINLLRHIKPIFALFLTQIAIQIYTVLDKTMIGVLARSNAENGYYDQTQRLIQTLTAVVTSIGVVMASRMAHIWNQKEEEQSDSVQDLLLQSFRLVFTMSIPIAVGLTIVAPWFVPIFFGDGYEPMIRLMRLLAWIIPIIGCSNIMGMQLLIPTGREKLVTRSVTVGAVVNVILNLMMIPIYGAYGAVMASVISEVAVTVTQMLIVRRELKLSQVLRLAIRYGLFSLAMGLVGMVLMAYLSFGLLNMLLIVGVCMAVYLMILLISRDPIIAFIRNI